MIRGILFRFLLATSIIAFMFCNKEQGVLQPDGVRYGSISGKIIHPPDSSLSICLVTPDGIDTATINLESRIFFFDSVKWGSCIIQVSADSFAPFEQLLILNRPSYICHDIVLDHFPRHFNYVYPSCSQYLDSAYLSISSPQATDSGFWCYINFNDQMDTASVNGALTLSPDTVGIQKIWTLTTSLAFFYTYRRLSTIDTVEIKIASRSLDQWGDTLDRDFTTFFPVDTAYLQRANLKGK
jgi:hypothetical protein